MKGIAYAGAAYALEARANTTIKSSSNHESLLLACRDCGDDTRSRRTTRLKSPIPRRGPYGVDRHSSFSLVHFVGALEARDANPHQTTHSVVSQRSQAAGRVAPCRMRRISPLRRWSVTARSVARRPQAAGLLPVAAVGDGASGGGDDGDGRSEGTPLRSIAGSSAGSQVRASVRPSVCRARASRRAVPTRRRDDATS